jgi:ABC-type Fe3+ transport system substrate-binding protein
MASLAARKKLKEGLTVIKGIASATMFVSFMLCIPHFGETQTAWNKIVAEAKKEGSVVVNGPSIRELSQGLTEGFKRAYGIDVEYLGLGFEVITRMEREALAGKPSIDMYMGGTRTILILMDKSLVETIDDKLLLAEVKEPKNWRGGKLKWVDTKNRFGLQTTEWVMTDLFVNRNIVKPEQISSWKDLLKPEWKGKIGSFDPRIGGAGQAIGRYLIEKFGEEFVVKLYQGQQVTFTREHRQVAEWAARGTYPIVLAAVQSMIERYRKEGFPLVRVFPKDGPGSLLGGFSTVAMLKNPPHPNAATLFLNWVTSKDGQEVVSRALLEPSRRVDVPTSLVPDYVLPQPGVKYDIDQYSEEWQREVAPKLEERLQKALGK